jgi:hypothetical protein
MARRVLHPAVLCGLPVAALWCATALAVNPPGAPDDHFLCYKVGQTRGTICANGAVNEGAVCASDADCGGAADSCVKNRFVATSVSLEDQFDSGGPVAHTVVTTSGLCLPANKNSEGVVDAVTHLQSYKLKNDPPHTPQTKLAVVNQFGALVLDTVKTERLLVPAAKNLLAPVAEPNNNLHNVDHFKCYKVRVTRQFPKFPRGVQVSLQEQFENKVYDVKRPTRLCNPVDKNGEGIKNPNGHLLCYKVAIARKINGLRVDQGKHTQRLGVYTNTQLGPSRLDTKVAQELCVPSIKNVFKFTHPADGSVVAAGTVTVSLALPGDADLTTLVVTLDGNPITGSLTTVPGLSQGPVAGVTFGAHLLQATATVGGIPQSVQAAFDAVDARDQCEVLNGAECLLPFPSSRFLVPAATDTGYHLNLPAEGMPTVNGPPFNPAPFNALDGFSPTVQILMHFPQGVDPVLSDASRLLPAGCCGQPAGPPWIDTRTYTDRSLDADSPTLLIDALTGEHILHFVEVDARAPGNVPRQVLFLRPAKSLVPGHRYIVAVRDLKAPNGDSILPEGAFRALRDHLPTEVAAIENRRTAMEQNVFTPLAGFGIPRGNLILAFDFVVQSENQLTRQILSMRDQAYAYLQTVDANPLSIPFTVDAMTQNNCATPGQVVWRYITGTFQSPLFLDAQPSNNGVQFLNVDGNDLPVQNGFMSAAYSVSIPCSVLTPTVSRPITLGHGLFGRGTDMTGSIPSLAGQVTSWTYIAGATDWMGLSNPDVTWVAARIVGLGTSQLNNFEALPDRLRQGMLNTLVLTRMMKLGIFNRDPAFQTSPGVGVFPGPAEDAYYYGISLGGIMGTWLSSLTPDIDRFGIDVGAMNFSCLLQRSTQFSDFENLLEFIGITDPMQYALGLGLLHELWVSAEPAGFARHITSNTLPGSGSPKHILMMSAWLDKQVSNQCSEQLARTLGLPSLVGSLQQGLEDIPDLAGPLDSALVMYDTGSFDLFNPAHQQYIPPLANLIPSPVCDPHGYRPRIPAGILQLANFLQPGGQVVNFCTGICDAVDPVERPPSVCVPP